MSSCTGNRRGGEGGGRRSKNDENKASRSFGSRIIGGIRLLPGHPSLFHQHQSTTSGTVGGAIPQALGCLVGQSWGRTARNCLDPVGGGWLEKVHSHQR